MCKGTRFMWNDECEASFRKLKECLISTLMLAFPFGSKGYTVYCIASKISQRCVLMQYGQVITYASW